MTASKLVPKARPRLSPDVVRGTVERIIRADAGCLGEAVLRDCPVRVLGVRGYYRNTLGRPGVNDLGLYDDAIFIVSPSLVVAFNANCDPVRAGWNKGVGKFFAQLAAGVWPMRQGPHRGRPGHLRQLTDEDADRAGLVGYFLDDRALGEFVVRRLSVDGRGEVESGYQAINVHAGSERGTSSWGCQTIVPEQWGEFSRTVYDELGRAGQTWHAGRWLPYVLTEERLA